MAQELNELDAALDDAIVVAREFWGQFGKSLTLPAGFKRAALSRRDVRCALHDTRFADGEKIECDITMQGTGIRLRWEDTHAKWRGESLYHLLADCEQV